MPDILEAASLASELALLGYDCHPLSGDKAGVTKEVFMLPRKRRPTHPGELLLEDVIRPLGLTITDAAKHLGVTRKALSEFVNQRTSLSPEMAMRIAEATSTSPDSWMRMQMNLDLWNALQNRPRNVQKFPRNKSI